MKIIPIEQNTDAWISDRKGKITGSKLGDIVVRRGTSRKIGFYELLADRLALEGDIEDPMDRGHRLEDEAIKEFSKDTGIIVEKAGLCISDDNDNIAFSPDGLIKNGTKYTASVEIKCLSSARHLQAYFEKKIPSEYEEQYVQPFIVNPDQEKLYFVFYDPRVTVKQLHYLTIERKDIVEQIDFLKKYQEQVLKEVELLFTELAF